MQTNTTHDKRTKLIDNYPFHDFKVGLVRIVMQDFNSWGFILPKTYSSLLY